MLRMDVDGHGHARMKVRSCASDEMQNTDVQFQVSTELEEFAEVGQNAEVVGARAECGTIMLDERWLSGEVDLQPVGKTFAQISVASHQTLSSAEPAL